MRDCACHWLFKAEGRDCAEFFSSDCLGVMAIYLLNMLLAKAGMEGAVGINPISVLTVGSLGTGGVALLFGILFYNML